MQRPEINVHSRTFISELSTIVLDGGAKEDRTPDLLRAKQALSQLSYGPRIGSRSTPTIGGSGQIRTADLTLIRGAL